MIINESLSSDVISLKEFLENRGLKFKDFTEFIQYLLKVERFYRMKFGFLKICVTCNKPYINSDTCSKQKQ